MADKVYTPDVIAEAPFPSGDPQILSVSSPSSSGNYSPNSTSQAPFPIKKRAVELLSEVINTRSRKVLGNFDLAAAGGFQIGQYVPDVSGDIRITPAGIVLRNKFGEEVVVMDADLGDAAFAGRITTGSIVTGLMLLGDGDIEIDGINKRIVFYNDGIPSIILGQLP